LTESNVTNYVNKIVQRSTESYTSEHTFRKELENLINSV